MRGAGLALARLARTAAVLGLALALLVPALAEGKRRQAQPKSTEVVKEGKILVVRGSDGGEPQLTDEDGKRWLIVGDLRDEVLQLDGHRLKVWGKTGDPKLLTPTLEATRYEIVDSGGGRKPLVGVLRQVPSKQGYLLERSEGNLQIKASAALSKKLGERTGCKIWIVGDLEGTTLKAFKFGWINCKPPKAIKPGKEASK